MDEPLTYDFEMEAALHYYLFTGDMSRVEELVYQRATVEIDRDIARLTERPSASE